MRYLFEDCVLDTARRELRRGTDLVPVEPQVFDLLVYLICNRERVVSKDDLLASVWQGRIVSESTLSTRINAARSAIGDNGKDQRLIKTLPRKGLRFVGAVREAQRPAHRIPRRAAAVAAAVICAGLAGVYLLTSSTAPSGEGVQRGSPSAAATAQTSYPAKPITVIVPFAAGGPIDVVTRLVGKHMSRTLGQQLVVENVGGAGGSTGMMRAAQAQPDGYTIAIGNMATLSAASALYPDLEYHPITSFEQIGIVNFMLQAIVAKKGTAAKDLEEFIAYLKANHTKLNYGHAGIGSMSYVSGTVFNAHLGLKPGVAVYLGIGPALDNLAAGQFDYMVVQSVAVIPQIRAGAIKVYAIAAPARLQSLPGVPTTKEGGVDFIFSAWQAMVAPQGTPKEIVAKLGDALSKALDDPAIRNRFIQLGSTAPLGAERGPLGLQKLIESEMARITPVLEAARAAAN